MILNLTYGTSQRNSTLGDEVLATEADDDDFQFCDLTKAQLEEIVMDETMAENYIVYQPLMEAQIVDMTISRKKPSFFTQIARI